MLTKIRFISAVAAVYILTIGAFGALLYSSQLFGTPAQAIEKTHIVYQKPVELPPKIVEGIPVRIVIPSEGIDLPLDEGRYNKASGTWTLSPVHAQFASMTMPANDNGGTTFVYGHGTDAVFGKIGTHPPPAGTVAQLYTDNNHVFSYALETVRNLQPTDTAILDNTIDGPPQLIVQTCTGAFSQWRTMFTFAYEKVV